MSGNFQNKTRLVLHPPTPSSSSSSLDVVVGVAPMELQLSCKITRQPPPNLAHSSLGLFVLLLLPANERPPTSEPMCCSSSDADAMVDGVTATRPKPVKQYKALGVFINQNPVTFEFCAEEQKRF